MPLRQLVLKILPCLAISLALVPQAQAKSLVDTDTWRVLQNGEERFLAGELGEALAFSEKASSMHARKIEGWVATLQASLSPKQVKKAGDDIGAVRETLKARGDTSALYIVDEILKDNSGEYFGKSIGKMLAWLEMNSVYPEADILAGKIYESEGEPKLALDKYRNAWKNRDFLDVSDSRYDLAYRMSDLCFDMGEYGSCEKYLLPLLEGDALFGKPGEESPSLRAMMKTLRAEQNVDKFFLLYRHSAYRNLKAYQDLFTFYYEASNKRIDRAFPVAVIAAAISTTRLADMLKQDDFEYVYAGMQDLFSRIGHNGELSEYAAKNRLWNSYTMLATALIEEGLLDQAQSLLSYVVSYCPDPLTVRRARAIASQTRN